MTSREEAIAMMDWLREMGAIGEGCECMDEDGLHSGFPETCAAEYADYLANFEILLRNEVTEHVYQAIRTAARMRWRDQYGQGMDGPVMALRCKQPLPRVIVEATQITDSKLEPAPRRWWWPFGRRNNRPKPDPLHQSVPPLEPPEVIQLFGPEETR